MTPHQSPSGGATISLVDVSKRYGQMRAVNGVSLTIERGEFLTLLGASGSGKTTLLNMISGFVAVDEGDVLIDGRSVASLPPHRRNIGMVFQNYALFPHMTALENVGYPLRMRGVSRARTRERAEGALATVQLAGLGDRYPKQLSGGQQQRVALARALVFNPPILLMDEPLGALDKRLRDDLQLEIKRLHERYGITFVYVTHDQEEALVMSDRVAVIRDGRVEQVDTPEGIYEHPRTRFIAEFVGRANVFDGAVTREGDHMRIEVGPQYLVAADDRRATGSDMATLVVRPEKMRLARSTDMVPDAVNRWAGHLVEEIYLGSIVRFTVQLQGGPLVVAESAGGDHMGQAGDEVVAWWPIEDGVLTSACEEPGQEQGPAA